MDPTQPNPPKTERSGPNPTKTNPIQPNPWVNPTHGQRWVQAFIARRYISAPGCFWHRLSIPAAAGLLLWARQAGDIDREPQGRRLAAAAAIAGSATLSTYVGSSAQTCLAPQCPWTLSIDSRGPYGDAAITGIRALFVASHRGWHDRLLRVRVEATGDDAGEERRAPHGAVVHLRFQPRRRQSHRLRAHLRSVAFQVCRNASPPAGERQRQRRQSIVTVLLPWVGHFQC